MCTYAVICTGVISLLAVMIIPDSTRSMYYDNMIGGLVMNFAGPEMLKLGFHVFIVIVGVLILAGAVNTSLIGVNGVLNRVAEDGVLLDWFRKPHKKFGTTYRILNTMAILQILTILASRGDVFLLGEAYAFGVVWSFALKALGVLVLRYQRHDQEYKMGWNIRIAGKEIPIGLGLTTSMLFLVAIANLFSKKIATIYGVTFTIILYTPVPDFRAHQRPQETGASQRSGEVQPGSPGPGDGGHAARAPGLRAGGGSRLPSHAPSAKRRWRRPICGVTISW